MRNLAQQRNFVWVERYVVYLFEAIIVVTQLVYQSLDEEFRSAKRDIPWK